MTRRQFDRQAVLGRATLQFWEHGYEATSMRDLLDTMGIGRQSLYDTFGDKRTLFLECLGNYMDVARGGLAALHAPDGGLQAIEDYFASGVRMLTSGPARGCLAANTCVEVAPHDSGVRELTSEFVTDLRAAFAKALEVAANKGDLEGPVDPAAAWGLTSSTLGLSTLSKAGAPTEALEAASREILRTLRE